MNREGNGLSSLKSLGLTEMEGRIYIFLLKENPVTGYRIAQAVGKPIANIYKSIKSLEQKGAIIVEEDTKRLCRPVPISEFLCQLERRFKDRKETALEELTKLESISEDERIYQLRSADHVFERSRAMLEKAGYIVLLDVFPGLLEQFIPELQQAAARGLEVIAKTYKPMLIPGVQLITDSRGEKVLNDYPGQWLKLVIDAKEHLLALLSRDGTFVHQGTWSSSRFLSLLHHQGIWSEIILDKIGHIIEKSASIKDIRRILKGYTIPKKKELTGYVELIERFSSTDR